MKIKYCTRCWGTGKIPDFWDETKNIVCPRCNGSGKEPQQTNKEYMQTCNAEELGCFICENFFHGACGECRFCEKTELRHHCILGEWLKEEHKDA